MRVRTLVPGHVCMLMFHSDKQLHGSLFGGDVIDENDANRLFGLRVVPFARSNIDLLVRECVAVDHLAGTVLAQLAADLAKFDAEHPPPAEAPPPLTPEVHPRSRQ